MNKRLLGIKKYCLQIFSYYKQEIFFFLSKKRFFKYTLAVYQELHKSCHKRLTVSK